MKKLFLPVFIFHSIFCSAQLSPAVTCWVINNTGGTGFGNIETNVQWVHYSTNNVYVHTTDIPSWIPVGYDWPNNPWFPDSMNYTFKITLHPQQNSGTIVKTPYGHIGLWKNGVSIYNPMDTKSWKDSATWFQNAFYFENNTFDNCLGHPNGSHEYHTHVNPQCLYDKYNDSTHSPIIGYAFDGYPIYGAHAYTNTNGTGAIKRMESSYRMRSIADRKILLNGTVLDSLHYGPALSQYQLGAYMEDFEFVQGLGDLDEHNGRFCITPEYVSGTYAYFVTIDDNFEPQFPYVLGTTYYGKVQIGNTGPNSGFNSITETVASYTSLNEVENITAISVYPNPAKDFLNVQIDSKNRNEISAVLYDINGNLVRETENFVQSNQQTISLNGLNAGLYLLRISDSEQSHSTKILFIQ